MSTELMNMLKHSEICALAGGFGETGCTCGADHAIDQIDGLTRENYELRAKVDRLKPSGPYKPDSAQHQIDHWKIRAGLALDHAMKLQDEIKDLRAHLLSERRQKDAAQARADQAEKRLAAAKAGA